MRQLSGLDASFFYRETAGAPMHVGTVMVYDPSTAPGEAVTFDGVVRNIRRRLHLAGMFRRRIVTVPMGVDHPYWIEDPDFDLAFHVRRVSLAPPGDLGQLWAEAARILARPLDLSRPPWEIHVVDGLDGVEGTTGGGFALVEKVHHAAIDGLSGMEILAAIHDRTPDAVPDPAVEVWAPEQEPSPWELVARAGYHGISGPARLARVVGRTMPALLRGQDRLLRGEVQLPASGAPRTRFNGRLSSDRVLGAQRLPLADVRRAKSLVSGTTVNDVLITVVGGALRRYLSTRGELPAESLTAMVPISVRGRGDKGAGGNRVSAMFIPLGTDVADPVARLAIVAQATHASKQFANAVGARELIDYSEFIPGGLAALAARTSSSFALATNAATTTNNCVITNVPGPRQPIYFAGACLRSMFGMAPINDGMGLMHVLISYCGTVTMSFTSCRAMMPDPTDYADCLQASLDELTAAAR